MKTDKVLKYTLIGGIFLIPFIPLFISSSMFFPFITGKNFAFRILVELLIGGWAILALFDRAYRPRFSWLLVSIASFVGIIALADIFGENPFKSFWSNFERMEGLVTLLHLFAYFLVAGVILNTEKLWLRFFNVSVIASVFLAIYGLFQIAGKAVIHQGGVRLDATLGNATYLAVYMLFHIFITVFLLIKWRGGNFVRWLYVSIIALQTVILFFTATRGAILGLIGGVLLTALLIAIFEKERRVLKKSAVGILIAVIVIVVGFISIKNTSFVKDNQILSRLSSISLNDGQSRFMVWNMAWQGVKEKPILGWGQENFNFVFNKYYDPKMYAQEPWFDRTHNVVFDWLIAGGILGFLAYFSIPVLILYYLWRRSGTNPPVPNGYVRAGFSIAEKSVFTGLLAGYFFHNLFVFDNITSYILFFSIAAYIHSRSASNASGIVYENTEIDGKRNEGLQRLTVPIIIIAVIFSVYFFSIKGIITSRALIQAITPRAEGLSVNLEKFKEVASYNTVGKQEVVEQLMSITLNVKNSGTNIEMQTAFFELANNKMSALIKERPNDARLRIFYASLINKFGFYDEAIAELEKAIELSPKKQTIRFELGTAYLNKGELNKAFDIFEETYNLDTNFKTAEIIYRIGAIYAGRTDEVDKLIGSISDNDRADDRIIQAYVKMGRFDEIVKSLEIAIAKDPGNVQRHISLGAAYLELGRREDAINEIQKVIDLDPNFKEQGEFYIKEIRAGRNP